MFFHFLLEYFLLFILIADDSTLDIETAFFQVEYEMEGEICREQICLSEGKEKGTYSVV